MRSVLHVITTVNRGGAENHLVELVKGQLTRGWRVGVVYLKGNGYWAATLRRLGARVFGLDIANYVAPMAVVRLHATIKAWRPDVLHAHMPPAELFSRLALLTSVTKPVFVISKHNDAVFYRGPGSTLVGVWVARQAVRVIAISEAVRRYSCERLRLTPERVHTVHYGIAPEQFCAVDPAARLELRRTLGCDAGSLLILTIARLVPQKDLGTLLAGYALYRTIATKPSRLVIVGEGPLYRKLQREAETLGLQGHVEWTGFREDIEKLLGAADVFALTSIYEGFGLVLLEAMAARRPIIATAVSAIPEIVVDGRTGVLINPRRPDQLSSGLLSLEDGLMRRAMGDAASRRVRERFGLQRMVDSVLAVYEESLSGQ